MSLPNEPMRTAWRALKNDMMIADQWQPTQTRAGVKGQEFVNDKNTLQSCVPV